MKISMSEVSAFQACRRNWYWGSRQNLRPVGQFTSPKLELGTGIHTALQSFYNGAEARLPVLFDEWLDKRREELGGSPLSDKDIELAKAMLNEYEAEYSIVKPGGEPEFKVLTAEQEFMVPIPGTVDGFLVGTFDGLVLRLADNTLWVIDHKTAATLPDPDLLCLNQQFLAYAFAANELCRGGVLKERFGLEHTEVHGTLYNGLRKQKRTPNVKAPLFMRQWIRHEQVARMQFASRLARIHEDMVEPSVYPNPGSYCEWGCDFVNVCKAVQLGGDWKWLLKKGYEVRPPRGTVYENSLESN